MDKDCNRCLWATRDGECASWDCEFISKADAYEAFQMKQSPAKMIEYLRQASIQRSKDLEKERKRKK